MVEPIVVTFLGLMMGISTTGSVDVAVASVFICGEDDEEEEDDTGVSWGDSDDDDSGNDGVDTATASSLDDSFGKDSAIGNICWIGWQPSSNLLLQILLLPISMLSWWLSVLLLVLVILLLLLVTLLLLLVILLLLLSLPISKIPWISLSLITLWAPLTASSSSTFLILLLSFSILR